MTVITFPQDPEHFKLRKAFEKYQLPDYMWDGFWNYFKHRIEPGSFLTAMLSNDDVVTVVSRADTNNQHKLVEWVKFLYNDVPANCWGSKEKVAAWLKN
jgi:hypothetical protein